MVPYSSLTKQLNVDSLESEIEEIQRLINDYKDKRNNIKASLLL